MEYVKEKFDGKIVALLSDCSQEQRVLIIVGYLSWLYQKGYRGSKIIRHFTGVKQSFILQAQSIDAFNSEIVKQSIKSGRYSTEELRRISSHVKDTHQLPFTIDMVDQLESTHWMIDKWNKNDCDKKAVYLAVAIAFDTGRRISNLTHRDKPTSEDHCIRWGNVKLFMKPCNTQLMAGQIFKEYYYSRSYTLLNITSVQFHFITQKQALVHNIVAVQPIIIDRMSLRSSALVDKLVQWVLINVNTEHEEFLTRNVEGSNKKLLRRNVINAMKETAKLCAVDPDRISSHSIRRCYATNVALNDNNSGSANMRAGWTSNSQVPTQNYAIPLNIQGGLIAFNRFIIWTINV